MVLATENWSARTWQKMKTATRQFIVTGATTEWQAVAACSTLGAAKNVGFPQDSTIRAIDYPTVDTSKGPHVYTVTWTYAPQSGIGGATNVTEKLSREPIIEVFPASTSVFSGADAANAPYVNTAGDPVPDPPPRHVPLLQIGITRWETSYDVQLAMHYGGTTNERPFIISFINGGARVDVGQAWCEVIAPVTPVRLSDEVIPIKYSLMFSEEGFYDYVLNQGMNGWHGSAPVKYGRITDYSGDPIASPVRLGIDGRPFDPVRFKVAGKTPVASPYNRGPASMYEVRPDAVYIKRVKGRVADWTGMGLFQAG